MKIIDLTPRNAISMALAALPNSDEGLAIVAVDVRNGNVEVLSIDKKNFDWGILKNKKAIVYLWRNNTRNVDTLVKMYRHEICGNILEIKEEHPHLFE